MKKSVKRNARKGMREKKAKNNSRKRVSIKQKGGMRFLLFIICACIVVQALSKNVKLVDFNELFKGKTEVTAVQRCLTDNNNNIDDPITKCYNTNSKTKYDTDVKRGFSQCVGRMIDEIEGPNSVVIAARRCYADGVERVEALAKKENFEKCTTNLLTATTVDTDCSKKVIQFNYEEEVLSVKNTDEMQISTITIPGLRKPMTTLAIGNGLGHFTSYDLDKIDTNRVEVKKLFHKIMNAVEKNLPKYLKNIVFIEDDEQTIIRYFDRENPEDEVIEIIGPSHIFDEMKQEYLKLTNL